MKRLLAIACAIALVAMFVLVPFVPNVPSPNAPLSPFSPLPSPLAPVPSFLTLNAPVPVFQSATGQEITVNHQSFFIDAEDFFMSGLDNFDRTLLGNLKVAGGDTGINISSDRHHATLKNGQTVYYGVKIAPEDREKVRGVTFILVTTPKSGIPNIRDNYFEIKYVESVGGSAGSVKNDSTAGKAYQVISPNGDYWYYFSFKAVVKSGGILTEITPVFFGGPKIAAVAEKYIVCCWEQITTPLLEVPKCIPISWWYCIPYIDWRAVCAFRCALMKKIATNTANVACANGEAMAKELTILGTGFRQLPDILEKPLEKAIHVTDEQGDVVNVTSATIVSDHEIKVTMDIARCSPGIKCVTIDGAHGHGQVTFLELINDTPDTKSGECVFGAVVVRGTCEKVFVTLQSSGQFVVFNTSILNIFNVGCIQVVAPTQVTLSTTGVTASSPINTASYIYRGTQQSGTERFREYLGGTEDANLVTSSKPVNNQEGVDLDLATDINGNERIDDDDQRLEETTRIELCENALKKIRITLSPPQKTGFVYFRVSEGDSLAFARYADQLRNGLPWRLDLSKAKDRDTWNQILEEGIWVEGLKEGNYTLVASYHYATDTLGTTPVDQDSLMFHVHRSTLLYLGVRSPNIPSAPRCFKVYVPTQYGGVLGIKVLTPAGEQAQAIRKFRNPHDMPFTNYSDTRPVGDDKPGNGWYTFEIVGIEGAYTIEPVFHQVGDAGFVPWNFYFWATSDKRSDGTEIENLYDEFVGGEFGALNKFDRIYQTGGAARQWELTHHAGTRNDGGHCLGGSIASIFLKQPSPIAQTDARLTLKVDELEGLWAEMGENSRHEHHLGILNSPKSKPVVGKDATDYWAILLHNMYELHMRMETTALLSNLRTDDANGSPDEVWNHAVYKYFALFHQDPGGDLLKVQVFNVVVANLDFPQTPSDNVIDEQLKAPRARHVTYLYEVTYDLTGTVPRTVGASDFVGVLGDQGQEIFLPNTLIHITRPSWGASNLNPEVTEERAKALDGSNR